MDIFKSNIKKGVGEGNFGYGKYKKDGSGLDFTQQTKKKLQKEKDDFMKGKNKFGPEPTNYSNVMANLLEKATAKLDQINDKMAYKLDMIRPSKEFEFNDTFNLTGFKDKGEYKERRIKDVIYSIKKYNNQDKVDELIQLYQSRKKYLSIANKTIKINTKFSSFDKLAKMVFDEYIDIYYYSTIQKKYCKVVIDPNTNKIVSMKITNNKSVNFSLSVDNNLNSQLNNLFSLLEQVERTDDVSKPNVLKLKVSLDNFFNTHSTDTQVEEIQNELRDEYNTFVEENFEHKIDNDIIFIYSKFKNIINKIQNSLENKRTNFSLINKNFNNMRNFNMSRKEMIDFAQRMKEIRMSHNFSNDITKQHELFDVINELFTFSEGKISGTEYKIKQLVSKLPSDKKDRGKEKLNSLVDSLKKKGLKEKEIISRLDAKADKLDRLVAFSEKKEGKKSKLAKKLAIGLGTAGTLAAVPYATGDYQTWNAYFKTRDKFADQVDKDNLINPIQMDKKIKEGTGLKYVPNSAKQEIYEQVGDSIVRGNSGVLGKIGTALKGTWNTAKFAWKTRNADEMEDLVAPRNIVDKYITYPIINKEVAEFGRDGKVEEHFSKKSKKASETLKKAALLGTAGAGATVLANPYINKAKEYVKDAKEDFEAGRMLREDERVKGGMSTKDLVKGLQGSEKELITTKVDLEKANDTINTNKAEYEKTLATTQEKHAKDLANLEETYKDSAALKKAAEEAQANMEKAQAAQKEAEKLAEAANKRSDELQSAYNNSRSYIKKVAAVNSDEKLDNLLNSHRDRVATANAIDAEKKAIQNAVSDNGVVKALVGGYYNVKKAGNFVGGLKDELTGRVGDDEVKNVAPGAVGITGLNTGNLANSATKTPENAVNNGQSSSTGSSFEFRHINPSVPMGFPMMNNNLGINMPTPKVDTSSDSDIDSKVEEDVVGYFYSNKWKLF